MRPPLLHQGDRRSRYDATGITRSVERCTAGGIGSDIISESRLIFLDGLNVKHDRIVAPITQLFPLTIGIPFINIIVPHTFAPSQPFQVGQMTGRDPGIPLKRLNTSDPLDQLARKNSKFGSRDQFGSIEQSAQRLHRLNIALQRLLNCEYLSIGDRSEIGALFLPNQIFDE